jgi:hypothetical protein
MPSIHPNAFYFSIFISPPSPNSTSFDSTHKHDEHSSHRQHRAPAPRSYPTSTLSTMRFAHPTRTSKAPRQHTSQPKNRQEDLHGATARTRTRAVDRMNAAEGMGGRVVVDVPSPSASPCLRALFSSLMEAQARAGSSVHTNGRGHWLGPRHRGQQAKFAGAAGADPG